jgi:hypothetical protein
MKSKFTRKQYKRRNKQKRHYKSRKVGGEGEEDPIDATTPTKKRSKNDSKIRIQFFNPRTSAVPYSVISVLKGPTTGIFDYMWYNIRGVEEMLSRTMYGLKKDPLPNEIVYNVKHNENHSQEKPEQEEERKQKEDGPQ